MSQPPIVDEPGGGKLQIWPLPATLLALVTDVSPIIGSYSD